MAKVASSLQQHARQLWAVPQQTPRLIGPAYEVTKVRPFEGQTEEVEIAGLAPDWDNRGLVE